ncbi:MAG: ImmA/IrrE family metallo-endopeptidase [Gammaproteobacteria bacterium]|nr:ImmA/IrrE family metallo-endopeptidase [Gammaproteobacteria bacterium]
MNTVEQIRQFNIANLIEEVGSQKKLGELTETDPSYFSQVVNGTKNCGPIIARRVEKALGHSVGWLDRDHENGSVLPDSTTKRNEALKFLKPYLSSIPVDVSRIAYDLGIAVVTLMDLEDHTGFIKCKNDKYIIGVNANMHPNRQRFTIAHELAHYFLHKELINGDGIIEDTLYRSFKPDINEREANRLAGEILMPHSFVNSFWVDPDFSRISVKEFASRFQVSEQAMSIQLGIPH